MIVVCAWCEREGRPAFLREKEPLEDRSVSHGMCRSHEAAALAEVHAEAARGAFDAMVDFLTARVPETFLRDGYHEQIAFVAKAGGGVDIVGLPRAPLGVVECFLRGSVNASALCVALVAEAWCTVAADAVGVEAVELWKAERGSLEDLPGRWEELVVTVSAPGRHLCRSWRIERDGERVRLGAFEDEAEPSRLWRGLWRT